MVVGGQNQRSGARRIARAEFAVFEAAGYFIEQFDVAPVMNPTRVSQENIEQRNIETDGLQQTVGPVVSMATTQAPL